MSNRVLATVMSEFYYLTCRDLLFRVDSFKFKEPLSTGTIETAQHPLHLAGACVTTMPSADALQTVCFLHLISEAASFIILTSRLRQT
ncbi:hypothetical protein KIN20_018922 [Parelaphostrongylus tenuis]|uniref:Uncharacterized protein n=1 Tax=Parelaphostrongylus tenuis TaxID=148309 RepID=A0AAD5QRX2_PARTN|nr:hypothetical protein KIN20_018922 [Parelaphostrongylus tenuis]